MTISTRYPGTFYTVFTKFSGESAKLTNQAPAMRDPTPYFDDAVDAWSDERGEGHDAWVFEMTFAGEFKDVTDLAEEWLIKRLNQRHADWPEWMLGQADIMAAE